MSVSENSTLLANNRENEGSYQLLDDRYNNGPTVNAYDKSPYTDPDFVTLDVGPNHTIFRLHRIVLSQSPELEVKPFSKLWGDKASESIILPDLDEPTAHTLVHYLYSGLYQTLYPHDPSIKGGSLAAYKLGTCVYVASVRYKLPGLADLSKEQINVSGEDLSILDILSVARSFAFPGLPEEEGWYPEYLEAAIHKAFEKDRGFFTTGEFADQLEGGRRFRQVVMKAVVGTLSSSSRAAVVQQEEVEQSRVETPVVEESEEVPGDVEMGNFVGDQEIAPEQERGQEQDITPTTVDPKDDELILDAIEPTASQPIEPEPFTDEVGFGTSQTYRQFSRTNSSAEPEPPITLAKRPIHERFDSLVSFQPSEEEETLPEAHDTPTETEKDEIVVALPDKTVAVAPEVTLTPLEELEKLEAEAEVEQAPVSPAAKKNRRKKMKKSAIAAAAAAAAAAAEVSVEAPVIANGTVVA